METPNLCSPLVMEYHSALKYCQRYVCGECLGVIQPERFEDGLYIIQCVRCGTTIREGGGIRQEAVDEIMHNRAVGERQMKDDLKISAEQAIKDLGF